MLLAQDLAYWTFAVCRTFYGQLLQALGRRIRDSPMLNLN